VTADRHTCIMGSAVISKMPCHHGI